MDHHASSLIIELYFIVSWAFAAYMIYNLMTDGQKNPSSQYSCLVKFLLGPPLMLWLGWLGMLIAVLIGGVVLVTGPFLTLRKSDG